MKKFFSKIGIIFFMALILGVFSCGSVFAADNGVVGVSNLNGTAENSAKIQDRLLLPELGWKRYDDTDPKVSFGGSGSWLPEYTNAFYNYADHCSYQGNHKIQFNFTGSKLRLIISRNDFAPPSSTIYVYIDNVLVGTTSRYGKTFQAQTLLFEKLGLEQKEHYVTLTDGDAGIGFLELDAIDIDKNGELKPYNEAISILATGITLDKTSLNMLTNQAATESITATVTPDNATNKTVAWKSSDETIAKVDSTGKVTAKNAGAAIITATTQDGTNKSASCTVTVTNPDVLATGITLNKTTASLNIGAGDKLIPTITPSNVTTTGVIWTSSNGGVVSVDADGTIHAVAAGTATITATTNNGLTATCIVTVNSANPTLDITSEKSKVNGGDTFTTYVALHNVTNIYAEDIRVNYDSNLFEFVGADVAKDGYEIYNQSVTTSGAIRFIVANKGENNGITGESQVLKLTFKAKNVSGKGKIEPSYGLVANGLDGTETETTCVGTEVEVVASSGDVNRDGKNTLADLAIDARHYNMEKARWDTKYNVDVVVNGQVDEADLKEVVRAMLAG